VALQSAGPGQVFAVRLRSTGKVIRAVALAPGRAEFAQGTGVQP
jgi:flagella basal body P-ring formation protein FlgA